MRVPETDPIDCLRDTLRKRGVKLTSVAEKTGIPYRSLQNYFAKKSEIPLTTFLSICRAADIPPEWPIYGNRIKLDQALLRQALVDVMGDALPTVVDAERLSVSPRPQSPLDRANIWKDAGVLAALVEGRYDQGALRAVERSDD